MNIITSHGDKTLLDLTASYILGVDKRTLLDTKDPISKVTNWDRIKRKYSKAELTENTEKYDSGDYDELLVKEGTPIVLNVSHIKRDMSHQTSDVIYKQTGYRPFISAAMERLLRDPNYTKKLESFEGDADATVMNNDVTVLVWSRALTPPGDNSQSGTWLNISPFVQSITTSVNKNSGSFNIQLSPIPCEYSEFFGWKISGETQGYDTGSARDETISQASIRDRFFFNTIFSENDLVFIKFEKLVLDDELNLNFNSIEGRINPANIVGQVFDMIGLVDNTTISTMPNAVLTTVTGRDLMKVFIEDGSYFFPEQFALNIFTDEDSLLTKRNRYELEAQSLAAAGYTFKSIQTILKFIFNKFSNIGLVPNSALSGYGLNLNKKKYQLKTSELNQKKSLEVIDLLNETFLKEERQGVWRIMELVFDPQIKDRVLADNSISQDNGSIINSIRKICQEPLVEFFGDTYGDKYNCIIRKPPFDKKGYIGMVYDDVEVEKPEIENSKVNKKIDKLKLKKNFADKVRKQADRVLKREASLSELVIEINDADVLIEPNFTYHEEAYSWYRVIPRGLGPLDEFAMFQLAPIVPFDEIAEIYGNKTFTLEYNYSPTQYLQDSNTKAESKYAEQQAFYDLQYCIQSHIYLPFTRRGTISLVGDRRIKRGLFIHYKPTDEVFYVDEVRHVRIIGSRNERQTILQVSRGMREKYIKGVDVFFPDGVKKVSYFNIVNTEVDNDASINNIEFLKNWKIDKSIFNFFIQARQWT